jgi:uncharacterized protein
MASTLMTPGVYINETNAFPSSVVAVETAVPVFIGYTEKAERFGKSLLHKPTKIGSFAEFLENFGKGFKSKFTITDKDPKAPGETFMVNGAEKQLKINDDNTFYMFNSIRLFYANGGSNCYVVSVGKYGGQDKLAIAPEDFTGSADGTKPNVFALLEKEFEPTMVVIPDIIAKGKDAYTGVYQQVLKHCAGTQSRFGIFDLAHQGPTTLTDDIIKDFRDNIGTDALNYGAAYYPWLNTTIVQPSEVDFQNLDASVDLGTLLAADPKVKDIITTYGDLSKADDTKKTNFHQAMKAASPTYNSIIEEIRSQLNQLPPSGAMAGIYTLVDNRRGVWKAPANVSLSSVSGPTISISNEEQKQLNVDVMSGKSVNVIRSFPGANAQVWGGRTLDGNSQDWRYINVRRTLIMIEQSIKLAARNYVFEPNDGTTWVTVKSMINNFLNNLWKQGALAGSAPELAYDVQIGLGATMTPQDILDGMMIISVKVAIVRPAEFIVINFEQMMQQA